MTTQPGQTAETAEAWRGMSTKHDGRWWSDWAAWLARHGGGKVAPPPLGNDAHPPLDDEPGRYVLEK